MGDHPETELARLRGDVRALRDALNERGIRDAVIEEKLARLTQDLTTLQTHTATTYVPIARYTPVERLVFGLVALVLMAVIGAMVGAVLAG